MFNNLLNFSPQLEQIGLEIHDLTSDQQQKYTSKYNCFQAELKRLQKEYDTAKKLSKQTIAIDMNEDFDDVSIQDDQRQRLLENTERLERTGNRLTQGYRLALETEQMGAQVLQDLHHQRETIQNTRNRLRETNADIGMSSRILNSMWMRGIRDKFVLYIVGAVFIIVVLVSIYLSMGSSSTQ